MFKLGNIAGGVKRVVGRFKQALTPQPVEEPKPNLFLGQHTDAVKNARRKAKRLVGARQFRIRTKALRRLHKLDAELGL